MTQSITLITFLLFAVDSGLTISSTVYKKQNKMEEARAKPRQAKTKGKRVWDRWKRQLAKKEYDTFSETVTESQAENSAKESSEGGRLSNIFAAYDTDQLNISGSLSITSEDEGPRHVGNIGARVGEVLDTSGSSVGKPTAKKRRPGHYLSSGKKIVHSGIAQVAYVIVQV